MRHHLDNTGRRIHAHALIQSDRPGTRGTRRQVGGPDGPRIFPRDVVGIRLHICRKGNGAKQLHIVPQETRRHRAKV
jgi:hypothetical protein